MAEKKEHVPLSAHDRGLGPVEVWKAGLHEAEG